MTFLVISIRLIETPDETIALPEFKEAYGTIVEEVTCDSAACKQYYPIYMIRRTAYAFILIALVDYPLVQIVLTPIVTVVPVPSRLNREPRCSSTC